MQYSLEYQIGNQQDGYSADVVVGITKEQRAALYDLVNIQGIKIDDAHSTSLTHEIGFST